MAQKISFALHERLLHWAAWEYKFAYNLAGFPPQSPLYRFLHEGYTDASSRSAGSKVPSDCSNCEAEEVNNYYKQLVREAWQKAEAFYLFYVHHVNVRQYAEATRMSRRTFYKRLEAAEAWFARKMPNI